MPVSSVRSRAALIFCLAGSSQICAHAAHAQTAPTPGAAEPSATGPAGSPAPATAPAAVTAPSTWVSGIKLSAQGDLGVTGNPDGPSDGINFGRTFTDRSNQIVLNQLLLTAQRPLDPKATGYDVGFNVQFLYGTDGRFVHPLGEFNFLTSSRYQLALVNANIVAHLPLLFSGGVDLKFGQFPTPLGYETIDPSTNPFYSHSYIFNFGLPLTATGGFAVAHVNPVLDVYLGGDSGVNTTLGGGDNNSAPAFLAGVNLTLLGGNLTILALDHSGPENPTKTVPGADGLFRTYNDIVATYKANPKLTLTTEAAFVRDQAFRANGFGVAQYASYTLNDHVTLNGRAEVFRDDNGFFVSDAPGAFDFVNVEAGNPAPNVRSGGPNTYTEFTIGVTWKPPVPAAIATLLIRPEFRYDHAFGGPVFNAGTARNSATFATDVVLGF